MARSYVRASAIAAVCSGLWGVFATAAGQHDRHGAPAASGQVLLLGTAWCADTPASVRVGNMRLRCGPLGLDTLTVSVDRDAVQLRSGATVVDPHASAAAGGSIADVLRTVPGVELDADGRIHMRGSTSVLVLMNGRRTPLTGDALVAFLRQMPATALQRIEAGTATSARQDAEGAAGVVNLVFRDDARGRSGMRSLAGSMATEDRYTGSVATSGRIDDVMTWDALYAISGMQPRTDSKTARWSLLPGDLPLHTDERSRAHARHRLHSVQAGAAATPTANTSLALRGAYSWMKGAYRNRTALAYTDAAGNGSTGTIGSLVEHVIPSGELSAIADLERGRVRFSAEARSSFVDEDLRGDYHDEAGGYRYMTTALASRQRDHVVRSGLDVHFSGIVLGAGQESRFRTFTAAHDATHFDATLSEAWRYESEVHAAYLTAQRSAGSLRAEAGLRVEADRTLIELDSASARSAVRFFPAVSAEWTDARRGHVYRLAYGRRIERPGADMLNPFSMGEDDMNEVIGNPSLVPEVSDQVELGMELHDSRATLQLTPFVRWTRDPIRAIKAASSRGGSTTTLKNLMRTRAAGADASVRAQPTDRTVVTLAGSLAHHHTKGEFSSSGIYVTARLTVDLRVTENTTAQLYAYRRSAQAIEQGEILPAFTSEVALTQRLAGDRGRLTLRIHDPLRSDRLQFRVTDATFAQESRRRTSGPLLSLFASYTVGGAAREEAPVRSHGPARIF